MEAGPVPSDCRQCHEAWAASLPDPATAESTVDAILAAHGKPGISNTYYSCPRHRPKSSGGPKSTKGTRKKYVVSDREKQAARHFFTR